MFKKSFLVACAAATTLSISNAAFAEKTEASSVATNAAATSVVQAGVFEGRSDHITTGGVSILKTSSGYVAVLEGNFSLDGAPEPSLGFGKDGFVKTTEFTPLKSNNGLQVYEIPASINPADFDEFYVWCSKFSVPLGVASLKTGE